MSNRPETKRDRILGKVARKGGVTVNQLLQAESAEREARTQKALKESSEAWNKIVADNGEAIVRTGIAALVSADDDETRAKLTEWTVHANVMNDTISMLVKTMFPPAMQIVFFSTAISAMGKILKEKGPEIADRLRRHADRLTADATQAAEEEATEFAVRQQQLADEEAQQNADAEEETSTEESQPQ